MSSLPIPDGLPPELERLEVEHIVQIAVLNDMRLILSPVEIARGGEHNSATFRIAQQPSSLDGFVCRAEVQTAVGTTYRLVIDREFELTSDIAVPGINALQLVYSDGDAIIRKTYPARFHVTASLNAVDESDPEFQNGLAQLQTAAFASVQSPSGPGGVATFSNISGQPVGILIFPPGGGGGLDEAAANQLYIRQDGGQMRGPFITAPGTGVTNPGIGIGDNSTGFSRISSFLVVAVGGAIVAQWSPNEMFAAVRLNMATLGITNLADPTGAQDAANRRWVEAQIAAIPQRVIPAARTYIATEVEIGNTATEFFNQPFFTNNNDPRTILVMVYPQYAGGTQGAFYDLEYSTALSGGLIEVTSIYPTPGGYMGGGSAVCFAVTVTPSSSQIQISLSVRQASNQPVFMTQIGSRATQRTYVVVQEMTQ